jgi:lysosomal acid lipase/cholesteryl ester hydrolase
MFPNGGAVLIVHRIPGPKGTTLEDAKGNYGKPVVLGHGFAHSGHTWVLNDEELSLAYALADDGYDVWLINFRGNFYSDQNKELNKTDGEFWNFDLLDIG